MRLPTRTLLVVLALPFSPSAVAAADLTGAWALEFRAQDSANVYRGECELEQTGETLAGSCASGWEAPVPVTGSVKERTATFRIRTGLDAGFTATFTGQLDEEETVLRGSWRFVDQAGNEGEGTFIATKQ